MEQQNYSYIDIQRRKRIPFILQLMFLGIGALLIIAFAILFNNEPKEADALLFSPVVSAPEEQKVKKDYSYNLLFADSKKVLFKETTSDIQTLKLLKTGTNLTDEIVSGKRIGFIGFLNDTTLLFLEDSQGKGRFTVDKYDIVEKSRIPFIAFNGPAEITSGELDNLVRLSPNKSQLAITHLTGLVIYTLKTEKESTILENTSVTYHQPMWISSTQLLIYQSAVGTLTPIVISSTGTISAVFPTNLKDLSVSKKGLPLVAVSNEGLHQVELKKTALILASSEEITYNNPVWSEDNIVTFANVSNLPTVIKTDKLGKKVITLKEFLNDVTLSNLIVDQSSQAIYFLTTTKDDESTTVTFYKMGSSDNSPVSYYSISKNL